LLDWLFVLYAYLEAAGIAKQKDSPLFRTIYRGNGKLTDHRVRQPDVYKMIARRVARGRHQNQDRFPQYARHRHHLINDGTHDNAQRMASHADPRTMKLYDRRGDQVSLGDVERISF